MIIIQKMTNKDLEQVLEIERESFAFPWQRSFFEYDLAQNNRYCLVAKKDERVVGYANLWHFADELQLANIAVSKKFRRQGIGSALLNQVIEIAKAKKCQSVFLEVRVSNITAQKLYEKFNFQPVFKRKRYYPDGEDAIIYRLKIKY
ncbi:MAG: ribosomal protein S18-alanine N-acetyltransferase [candidate division WOR-3 bacterium]